jgi:holo-[acyl-carrier protein] synthase
MIIGIGTDIIRLSRIAEVHDKQGQRFLDRCFTAEEQALAQKRHGKDAQTAYYAKRWAAKEALAKACGTGIGERVRFQDINISNDAAGRPHISVSGSTADYIKTLCEGCPAVLHLSLSDEKDLATAFVIISAGPPQDG